MNISGHAWPSIPRLAAIVAIVTAVGLGFNLGRQATEVHRLRREEVRLQEALEEEKAELAALESRQAYVQTDAFVEEWARSIAKLTQSGEIRVVVVSEAQEASASTGAALGSLDSPEEVAAPYWQQWWKLFFGPVAD